MIETGPKMILRKPVITGTRPNPAKRYTLLKNTEHCIKKNYYYNSWGKNCSIIKISQKREMMGMMNKV